MVNGTSTKTLEDNGFQSFLDQNDRYNRLLSIVPRSTSKDEDLRLFSNERQDGDDTVGRHEKYILLTLNAY